MVDGMLGFHLYFDIQHNEECKSCQLYASAALTPQGSYLLLISFMCRMVHVTAECGLKEEVTWKFTRTLPGIEPGTSVVFCGAVPQSTGHLLPRHNKYNM